MKAKFLVNWNRGPSGDGPITPALFQTDMSNYGYLFNGVEVEVDCGDPPSHAEVVAKEIAALRVEQGKHQAAITNIERSIQELLSIEHKPE